MSANAIDIKSVFFSYITPRKEEYFNSFSFPIKKVVNDQKLVLKDVSLSVEAGKITALMGRNGSGKTTLIKLISGMRTPESGTVRVFGENPEHERHRMGVCLGASLIYHRLTARENLDYFGRLYGVENIPKRIDSLCEMLELGDVLDNLVETYSFGMKMKLAIARSLIHEPELLILDEPTLGIDLHLAVELRKFIRELKCTVLLTTHYMEEVQLLADNICVIDKGEIQAFGTKTDVLRQFHTNQVSEVFLQATGT